MTNSASASLHQLSSNQFLHPTPPSFPSPARADGKTCHRHLHHPSLQAILCTQMSHRLEDSHFYSWEWLILRGKQWSLMKKRERNDPPAWHIPFLHKSDFMALSHAALLQAQTAGFILVHYRYLHKSQALLGWEFMQEISSFRVLPLLFTSWRDEWQPWKPCFWSLTMRGVYVSTLRYRLLVKSSKTHGLNLQVSLKNSCGFQEIQGFTLCPL